MRPMRQEDIAQVSEIDREAFPTIWPPTDYSRELRNTLAYCLVTIDDQKIAPEPKEFYKMYGGHNDAIFLAREDFVKRIDAFLQKHLNR